MAHSIPGFGPLALRDTLAPSIEARWASRASRAPALAVCPADASAPREVEKTPLRARRRPSMRSSSATGIRRPARHRVDTESNAPRLLTPTERCGGRDSSRHGCFVRPRCTTKCMLSWPPSCSDAPSTSPERPGGSASHRPRACTSRSTRCRLTLRAVEGPIRPMRTSKTRPSWILIVTGCALVSTSSWAQQPRAQGGYTLEVVQVSDAHGPVTRNGARRAFASSRATRARRPSTSRCRLTESPTGRRATAGSSTPRSPMGARTLTESSGGGTRTPSHTPRIRRRGARSATRAERGLATDESARR